MSSENDLINAELGVTSEPFRASRVAELKLASYRMFAQAKKQIDLFSYDLDPRVLSDRDIEAAISRLVRRSRQSQVRMMVFETQLLQSADHRLIALMQNLSSYIHLKVVSKEYQQLPFSFYLVDDSGLIYRPNHQQLESQIYFNEKLKVRDYRKQFDEIWEQGRIASEFRTLGI
ncbi:hypothetical protein [Pleionea litopenaei]|uniref:DUF7931 domain-containing protein n=1 Tax=Pleionea litopenaei TaxID=3070815 RepID=A0AA51X7L4_9GAMM|nr:hypothetical protein [Pleionea sp. HL-JVS1]WMS88001.1 hypothetical protein Q9312_03560 [Pleionea sp. HL-JVS1]